MLVSESKASEILSSNQVVALPSETVYGLAARIDSESAIKKIFSTKQRPFFDPLIVHVDSITMAKACVLAWPEVAEELAKMFWPGPLTLVLPKNERISDLVTSGLESVALRCPNHPVFLNLIKSQACPLAAPSANKFGKVSPTSANHVETEFDFQVPVVDGGPSQVGIESTVLLIRLKDKTMSILRKGNITSEQIAQTVSTSDYKLVEATSKNESPGHMKHHYMPDVPLILVSSGISKEEVINAASSKMRELPHEVEGVVLKKPSQILSAIEIKLSDDPVVAARELYSKLRESAHQSSDIIYFRLKAIHKEKSFEAVMERMTKASSLVL